MSGIAIITARGGSKRIPRKNIKDFLGKPIIAYSIEAALNGELFDEVMVSTDDAEIANIARQYGANVPFYRSEVNADDYAGTADVLLEVIDEYKKRNRTFDYLCCIYPTAPFVTSRKLRECQEKFLSSNADSLLPVARFSYPPQRSFIIDQDQRIKYKWPENTLKRSQDLEAFYHDVGQFYFIKIQALLQHRSLVCECTVPYVVNELEMQDIDNMEDWQMAEIKYNLVNKQKNSTGGGCWKYNFLSCHDYHLLDDQFLVIAIQQPMKCQCA